MRGPWLPSPPMSRAVMDKCAQRTGPRLWVDISEREILAQGKLSKQLTLSEPGTVCLMKQEKGYARRYSNWNQILERGFLHQAEGFGAESYSLILSCVRYLLHLCEFQVSQCSFMPELEIEKEIMLVQGAIPLSSLSHAISERTHRIYESWSISMDITPKQFLCAPENEK